MSWNPVLNLIKQIKRDYENQFNETSYELEHMIKKLNNNTYNEFIEHLQVNQKDEYVLIRYGLHEMGIGFWEDENSIYRECRSVVINVKDEELVLTPYRKFFNLDEVEENKLEVVQEKFKKCETVEITNKLDGSMQNARWYKDKVFMTGSMSLSQESSWRLAEGYSMLNDNYTQMLKDYQDYTFIFEYISLKDAHVVIYNKEDEGLHLIGIRDTRDGQQLSYEQVISIAQSYNVKVVNQEFLTLDELLVQMKTIKSNEKEGWILNLDGHFIKLKCDDYVSIHRLLDKFSSINVIIENVADGHYDDLISKVPEGYKQRVEKVANKLINYINQNTKVIYEYFDKAPKDDRKTFMTWVNDNVDKPLQAYVRNLYLGKSFNLLKSPSGSYKKLTDLNIELDYYALFHDAS